MNSLLSIRNLQPTPILVLYSLLPLLGHCDYHKVLRQNRRRLLIIGPRRIWAARVKVAIFDNIWMLKLIPSENSVSKRVTLIFYAWRLVLVVSTYVR